MATPFAVFCKTPGCGKRLCDRLLGYAVFTCRHCKQTHEYAHDIPDGAGGFLRVSARSITYVSGSTVREIQREANPFPRR